MSTDKLTALAVAIVTLAATRQIIRHRRAIALRGRPVLIIGGSRGLGLVIARELADQGAHLALVARDSDELDRARLDLESRGARVLRISADVRNQTQVEDAVSAVMDGYGVLDVLISSASKFAPAGLSAGVKSELAREGFRVTSVFPGLMRTGSTYNASFKGQHRREFAWFHTADALPGLSVAAESAARRIVSACRYGDAEVIITLPAQVAVLMNALLPGTMSHLLALTNLLLPASSPADESDAYRGWQSISEAAPSVLTRLADRATRDNNEMPIPGI